MIGNGINNKDRFARSLLLDCLFCTNATDRRSAIALRMLRGVSIMIFNNCHGRKGFEAAMRMSKQSNGFAQRQCMGFPTIPAAPPPN
ncbi:hypothetical protein WK65_01550 [Burkholderia ubonensis]|nr:hypothetical protein WK65_01550 [Burkholderia ubonensis]